ncbi:RTX toxin [gamma proteobacterium IMCC1989]|nr:RTX toxin [gamma proteobacterium IMCC1989]
MQKTYRNILLSALVSSALFTPTAFASNVTAIKDAGRTNNGTSGPDSLNGSHGNDRIFSGGVSHGAESIRTLGGSDRIVFTATDAIVADVAGNGNGHIRIRDLIIDNIHINPEADSISLGRLLGQDNLDANNIGNYLHVLDSNAYSLGLWRTAIFVNVDGDFSAADKQSLDTANSLAGGYGTDLLLEFQNFQGNNNFETVTGHPNNSVAQFQALMDMGFLELSRTDIYGSTGGDNLEGTIRDERIFPRGASSGGGGDDSVRGNGGADRMIFESGDLIRNGHVRIRDFIIDDVQTNPEADSVSIGELIGSSNINANDIGDYLHIVSGLYGHVRTAVFIKSDGNFTAAERQDLDVGIRTSSDLFLEFQGQQANNNFETLTGFADNTSAQFQALIDMGFFEM